MDGTMDLGDVDELYVQDIFKIQGCMAVKGCAQSVSHIAFVTNGDDDDDREAMVSLCEEHAMPIVHHFVQHEHGEFD